jgi:hypothetical protein
MFYYCLLFALLHFVHPDPQPAFTEQLLDANVTIGYGLALGDVDGDNKIDILLADKKQFVWYRNGDWKKFILAENLTQHDNVCIAAKDIDGDGKVEIAVGAQWNPGETSNAEQSGAVFYLIRPEDPTQQWKAFRLPHEPTVHRMKWIQSYTGEYFLMVLPLHGRGNSGGIGAGVNFLAYRKPKNVETDWPLFLKDSSLHLTHNFHHESTGNKKTSGFYIASKEGIRFVSDEIPSKTWKNASPVPGMVNSAGEVKMGRLNKNEKFITAVEPMHGNQLALYHLENKFPRVLLDSNIKEGHALGTADFLGKGNDQIVLGWRSPNASGEVGLRMYYPSATNATEWTTVWIDRNGMACEDLQVGDLNGDGKPDIVAAGRATKNLKIYWNRLGLKD